MNALQLTAIVSAVYVAGTAILVALLLRNVRSDSGPDGEPNTVPENCVPGQVEL